MQILGSLEGLAQGESIYSARFMGPKGYMVTFRRVDPLFVLDLSDPSDPKVLGKLKIPGYSDYLHPLDDTKLLDIGKEAEEESGLYQGVKMAIFDVSDVENPVELHNVVIGDRGSDSEVLRDHKAFLLDKSMNILVLPVTVAEIKDKNSARGYGEIVFQGAYVYSIENGFDLKGKITHSDSIENYWENAIIRSLYIENVLYTISSSKIQFNNINTLEKIGIIELEGWI